MQDDHGILNLADQNIELSKQLKEAKQAYAEHKVRYSRLLGKKIMANPKMAIDKIISLTLNDPAEAEFKIHYTGYEYQKALCVGLEYEIEARRSKISAIQSYLKYYGREDGGRR